MNKKLETKNIIIAVLAVVVIALVINQMPKPAPTVNNVPELKTSPTSAPATNPPTTPPPATAPAKTPTPAPVYIPPPAPKPAEPVVNPEVGSKHVPQTYNVKIQNYSFTPSKLAIYQGDIITWTNYDSSLRHIIVGDSPLLSALYSPMLDSGKTYTFVFPRAGTWNYHCKEHPIEKGTITVVEPK